MSHTSEAFKKGKAMIAFLTAGVPSMEDTVKYVLDLEKAGVDLIEIGVPFSDPIADGPVIMEADVKALENHIHLPQVMELVKTLRTKTQIPIVLLTYYNPVFNYPSARFFEEAKEIGIDGVIIPDLPFEEQGEIRPLADANGVDIIQMVAPTSEERIRESLRHARLRPPAPAPVHRHACAQTACDLGSYWAPRCTSIPQGPGLMLLQAPAPHCAHALPLPCRTPVQTLPTAATAAAHNRVRPASAGAGGSASSPWFACPWQAQTSSRQIRRYGCAPVARSHGLHAEPGAPPASASREQACLPPHDWQSKRFSRWKEVWKGAQARWSRQ